VVLRPHAPWSARLARAALLVVLVVPVWWGIHASAPWDVDHIAPGSVLKALAARFGPGWSSSYGPVPYELTALVYAPLLALMRLAHELGRPTGTYPWGFVHPDAAVAVLVVAARLVNLALALGVAALAAREAVPRAGEAGRAPAAWGWLVPLLLIGSPVFVYYARTSNVDLGSLFWVWLAFALAETRTPSAARWAGAGAAAAFAVCTKEQVAPLVVAAGLTACVRAWRGDAAGALRGPRAAALVVAGAVVAYALAWELPLNLSGWLTHHRFLFETARYPRTFAATLTGFAALGARALALSPAAFGWPVLLGVPVALLTRPSLRGLGPRAAGAALYLVLFIGSVGYVYPRFLLPLLVLVLPVAARGLAEAVERWGARGRAVLTGLVVAAALAGGPVLDVVMLRDPRLAAESWLAREAPAGALVEIAGNPHFQARVPQGLGRLVTTPDSLRERPRGPRGDIVLVSSIDAYEFQREPLRSVYADSLRPGGPYRLARVERPPRLAALLHGLTVAPEVEVYVRARGR
jgi:hypothetical protein